jgi:hypothetical protein
MPSSNDVLTHFGLSLLYELTRHWFLYLVMIATSNVLISRIWGRIKSLKDIAVFWCCAFLLLASAVTLLGSRPQEPNLVGGIQTIATGEINNDKDTVAAIEMTILNTGGTQSIAQNWKIDAKINGAQYAGTLASMPDTFTFDFTDKTTPNTPQNAITYHKEDLLPTKTMQPIQQGAVTPGVLFVIFEGIPGETFMRGADFVVTFEDAYSNKYTATGASSAKRSDRIATMPGLHTEYGLPRSAWIASIKTAHLYA